MDSPDAAGSASAAEAGPNDHAGAIESEVERARAALIFSLTPQPVTAGGAFSIVIAFVLWPTLGGPILGGWTAARILISVWRVLDCRQLVRQEAQGEPLTGLRRRFFALMVLESLSWSVAGLLFAHHADSPLGLALLASLAVVAAVSVFSLGGDFRASSLFFSVVLLPNAVQRFIIATPDSTIGGVAFLILEALLLLESRRLAIRLGEMLRLRLENAAIAAHQHRAMLLAEHSNRAKSRFLATVSHEMRTPLNGMLGMAQLMLQGPSLPGQRERLDAIMQSGRHLQSVIDDLLDQARIDSGRVVIARAPLDLHQVAREVVDLLRPLATQRGLRFDLREDPALPRWIEGDAGRIKQILHNLLGNAIKFTHDGAVGLEVAVEGTQVRIDVHDTGIGIADDQLERIFEAFEQVVPQAAARTQAGAGLGLGLAISRELARAMGGDLVGSSRLGQGSRFVLSLPLVVAAEPSAASATGAPAGAASLRGLVLVAEDNPVNATIVKSMLELLGLDVEVAENGRAALQRMSGQAFSAVLMDCQMPLMDGWQAATDWRTRERETGAARMPIIALTANAVAGDRERCLAAGMDDYLAKPVDFGMLAQVMRRHLERADRPAPNGADAATPGAFAPPRDAA